MVGALMDLLRFLLRLPLLLVRGIFWLLHFVIGDVSWSAPPWLRATGRGAARAGAAVRARPLRFATAVVLLAAIGIGGRYGYIAWRDRPRPIEEVPATLTIADPPLTDFAQTPIDTHPMRVSFSRSVAPLALVGKIAKDGFEITPALAGHWYWASDRELLFTPDEDWLVGQT